MNLITIRGPRGAFHACPVTGRITTAPSQIPEEYRDYKSVDVTELLRWGAESGADITAGISILCVGLNRHDGQYIAAEEVCREEWLYAANHQAIAA